METLTVLTLLAALQIKHLFADYYLQNRWMLCAGNTYLHLGRAAHCAIHVVGSAICLALFGVGVGLAVALLLAEFLLHYHIDLGKACWGIRKGHGPTEASYWRAFGMDQTLHQLTYVGMVYTLL